MANEPAAGTAAPQSESTFNLPTRPSALRSTTGSGLPSTAELARLLALVIAGAAAALLVMTQGSYGGGIAIETMVEEMKDTSQWLAWVLVLSIQTAVWVALVPAMWFAIREARAGWTSAQTAHVAVVAVLLAGPLLGRSLFPTSHDVQAAFESRMFALSCAGIVVGILAVIAIVRAHEEIRDLEAEARAAVATNAGSLIEPYLKLRGRVHFVGGALAVIVALAVLATGGQRNTIVAMEIARATRATTAAGLLAKKAGGDLVSRRDCPPEHATEGIASGSTGAFATDTLPQEVDCLAAAAVATRGATRYGTDAVWSFGLYYSFALIAVYLPPYLSLVAVGRRIRDRTFPFRPPTDPEHDAVAKRRGEVNALLQLEKSPVESLKAATLVLVPLLTSLASSLLGGVKIGG